CTSMPTDMKCTLTERFVTCFESDPLYTRIEASDPLELPYETLHFSWYNHHCTQGHDAPQDTLPRMMKRTGLSRTNHGQLIPYTSSDIANNAQIYDSLKRVLNDVFAWLDQKARYMLPHEYRHLEAIASILPDGNTSPVHPFVGLVINLNAVTRAH
ncbi:hypothetical protein FOMPIDRAFT_1085773, partial [Fomitopsis schrenkii]